MRLYTRITLAAAVALVAVSASLADAQLRRVRAELAPAVESKTVKPGAPVALSLKVTLPKELHVQANEPRDPSLIPTVLTVTPTPGVTVGRITYPAAIDFEQAGQAEPLAVYGHEFVVKLDVKLAADVKPGPLTLPAKLRYQACDDKMCFPPTTTETSWTLTVGK
jgi:DsbC/DsbD-like thiol-disulfide interchange protein